MANASPPTCSLRGPFPIGEQYKQQKSLQGIDTHTVAVIDVPSHWQQSKENLVLYEAWILLDVIIDHTQLRPHLGEYARIVENPAFDTAIVKVNGGKENTFLDEELRSGCCTDYIRGQERNHLDKLVVDVNRERGREFKCQDLLFIPFTSNVCE
ncbi:hypothetical protein K470DRAFT_264197 [Piedraia hortae CBS 480.64]|uniref:Uncharacterized protein n=1 Tax=Piedraia hortae CBS 480.64 TaxID=1314780 RepID=A0A6A7BZQ7_9PEZI|nr:hypothetical protein K470DRAFT_264197 [Piedraia hortae CBS 480.64]